MKWPMVACILLAACGDSSGPDATGIVVTITASHVRLEGGGDACGVRMVVTNDVPAQVSYGLRVEQEPEVGGSFNGQSASAETSLNGSRQYVSTAWHVERATFSHAETWSLNCESSSTGTWREP